MGALRQLQLAKQLEELRAKLGKHNETLSERKKVLTDRQARTRAAFEELTADATQEQRDAVDAEIEACEAEEAAIKEATPEHEAEANRLTEEISRIEAEITEMSERSQKATKPTEGLKSERKKGYDPMEKRTLRTMNYEERAAFFAQDEVKTFLGAVRSLREQRGVSNAKLTIPDVMFDILRNDLEGESKLISHVTVKAVSGSGRQNIIGAIPEAIWTEAVGELNELDLSLNQLTVDGFLVGGFIAVANSYLDDSDIALGTEIINSLRKAIGKAIDNAILFGTGNKMPVGIITRLAQTARPDSWEAKARPWVDLHTTNIKKLNINGNSGTAFFAALLAEASTPKPDYSRGVITWVMNRKTHTAIKLKAMDFNSNAVLVSHADEMPVLGGPIVEVEKLGDNEIAFGYFDLYLLAEREGATIESSTEVRFLQNQTCFKGLARYDGKPMISEAFALVSFDNTDAVTEGTFAPDYANTEIGVLGVTAAAGTATGDTCLTVTGTEASGTTLAYKIGAKSVKNGEKVTGYTALTSGTTQITCAAGKVITVVELNAEAKAIKLGTVVSVPRA